MNTTITYIDPAFPKIIQSQTIVNGKSFLFSYTHSLLFDGKMSEEEYQQLVSNYHEYFSNESKDRGV